MEQCLDLNMNAEVWRNLELVLYTPWIVFAAIWLLSFVFYNEVLFFSSIFLNYIVYAHITYLARGFAWISPASRACQNAFYDIYRYQWPNPAIIAIFSYTMVMAHHHWRQRALWWRASGRATGNGWNWLRRVLLGLTVTLPPILFVATLVLLRIQSVMAIVLNLMAAFSAAVLSLHLVGNAAFAEELMASIKQQFV